MRIFDETLTNEIKKEDVDFLKFKLEQTKILIKHHDAVQEVKEEYHYEIIAEYPNGGKDLKKVIDVEYVPFREAYDEYEDVLYLVKLSQEEILNNLRSEREIKCFQIINRGVLWYNTLTEEQRLELDKWYKEWLDITDTYRTEYEKNPNLDIETIIPITPSWLK